MTNADGVRGPLPDVSAQQLVGSFLADLADDGAVALPPPTADRRPPDRLRDRLLAAARDRARGAVLPDPASLPEAALPYATQIAAWDELLAQITDSAVPGTVAVPAMVVHGWGVADTLGHLLAVDALAARALGIEGPPETGTGDDVATRTSAVHSYFARLGLDAVAQAWRAQAVAILRHAQAGGERRAADLVNYLGFPLAAGDVLLDRAFEAWVHAEDLRESLGLSTSPPPPEHVARLTDLGARILPYTLQELGVQPPVVLELTGPGGGTWSLNRGDTDEAPTRLAMDAVAFCHLAGGRVDPDRAVYDVDGDVATGAAVVRAVAALARL